jgi:hypothetical protein
MHKPFRAWRKVLWLSLLVSYAAQLPGFAGINRGVILTCIKEIVESAAFVFDFEYHNDSLVEGMLYLDSGVGQIPILDAQMGETYCRILWCIPKDKEDLATRSLDLNKVLKPAFTGMAFSLTMTPLTDTISMSCLPAIHTRHFPSVQGRANHDLLKKCLHLMKHWSLHFSCSCLHFT